LILTLSTNNEVREKNRDNWKIQKDEGVNKVLKEWQKRLEWHKNLPDNLEIEENQKVIISEKKKSPST
jgi:hypothetical protein